MNLREVMTLGFVSALSMVAGLGAADTGTEAGLRERAEQLAREVLLVDSHLDTPWELRKRMQDISGRIEGGHFDYVRARQGGLDAAFMAVYTPPEYEDNGGAKALAEETIDLIEGFARQWPDRFVGAQSPEDIGAQFGGGRVSILMGMENGSPLEGKLENLKYFYNKGIRYITLVHSKNNHICDSSFDEGPRWHGLTPFGREVVAEMNRLGMMIDVSHVSDDAFFEIVKLSRAPVVATHSACRHFTPGWHRNMSDEMVRLLAAKGGVIQINFGSIFVNPAANAEFVRLRSEISEYVASHGLQGEDRNHYVENRWKKVKFPRGNAEDVVANINFAVKLAGIDHVGLGSDFDGVTNVPEGLEDVSCYPNLIAELLRMDYSPDDIRKICGGNFLRVWTAVDRAAARPRG